MFKLAKGLLFFALPLCFSMSITQVATAKDRFQNYWTVEEYQSLNKDQATKSAKFSNRVENEVGGFVDTGKVVKIVMVLPGFQVSDYWRRSIVAMERRLSEYGVAYELQTHFTRPGEVFREQSKKLTEFLSEDPDYVVFTLNADQHRVLIKQMIKNDRAKIILQNITTPLKAFRLQQPLLYVGFDHVRGTELLAEQYLSRFSGQTNFAIMYGEKGYVSDMRCGRFQEIMAEHERMQLVSTYHVGFNREKAYEATKDLLKTSGNLGFIFSCSTDIAHGVTDALKELGQLGKVITNGWGGGDSELLAIQDGDLEFTVMRMNDDNGVAMAEAIVLDSLNMGDQLPTVYAGSMVIVDQSDNQKQILELRKRAFRYSE